MKSGVTIQDIADALGLSRNTVSKVLNGKYVPARTRNAVLNAAIEMGYKSYRTVAATDSEFTHKKILLNLSLSMPQQRNNRQTAASNGFAVCPVHIVSRFW